MRSFLNYQQKNLGQSTHNGSSALRYPLILRTPAAGLHCRPGLYCIKKYTAHIFVESKFLYTVNFL